MAQSHGSLAPAHDPGDCDLDDDTVVALSSTGGRLIVRDPGETRVLIVDPPRTLVAALPGDTLVLAGGPAPGVSVVALAR